MLIFDYIPPHNIKATYGGWLHIYAVAIMVGIFASIIASWFKFRRYRIPTDDLIWSIVFIIPAALLGASFLGKDDPANPMPFWSKFAFWHQGMSIHGGVLFGIIAGGIIFYIVGRKHKVSLWIYGDCIIPNILLGQVLGRWGNFFNHELLGSVVSYDSLSWLPAFIRDNCFKLIDGLPEGGVDHIVYRAPIFLYESIGNFGLWVVITFMLPNLGKWFGKKPWKVEPDKYQFKLGYNIKQWFTINRDSQRLTWTKMWNDVYFYHKVPDNEVEKSFETVPKFKDTGNWWKNYQQKSKINIIKSKKLYELNNPNHYGIMYAGVQMGMYLFGWNMIRFVLELQRDPPDLFIIGRPTLDYTIILLTAAFGLFLAIFAQFVVAKYFRKHEWTYEKEY